ncbi:hypothetical protein G4Y79_15850 [Phototrophicus methaneseepsis]|uniref:Uncharacterized protein n=1 Tax=Phototrophicus methaneseepsis TaxID=2710758 RepID=A0A7S8E6A7_9CHLR|nr:hypothetical protein [Phototrophicus methaneseepsis]QPC81176.1 hypothetical protein G4Y79_15850 [Phototrophicus methaneseepsis]
MPWVLWALLRNPRTALLYSAGLITAAITVFVIANVTTDGNWMLNLISANTNPFTLEQYTGLLRQFVRLHWPLLLLSSLYVLYELYATRLSLFSIWFIISFASTVASGTWGAGDSYFATTIAASCLLAGNFVAKSLREGWQLPWLPKQPAKVVISISSLALLCIYSLTVIKLPTSGPIFGPIAQALDVSPAPGHRYPLYDAAGWTVGYAVTGHFPSPQDYENGWYIVDRIKNADKPAMTEDPSFMIQAGQVVITNATQLNNLYKNHLYDPSNLIKMIEDHAFSLIVLRARFYPEPVLKAIGDHYHVDEVVPLNGFDYSLWVPNEAK